MRAPYQVAKGEVIDETDVSRSRFICYLQACSSAEAFKTFLQDIRQLHPQANHHCYAFILDHPLESRSYGFSDDGEPSGTAGRPMLMALQGANIGEVAAIVVRYFGGTKLGTGGLQRAYGASVRSALEFLETKTKIPMVHKSLSCQYTQVNDILRLMEQVQGQVVEQSYQEHVELVLAIPEQKLNNVGEQLKTLSAGQLTLKSIQ